MTNHQNQSRVLRVLAALLISMTVGAIVLMALGNNPPKAGLFTLAGYYRLNSIEQIIQSEETQYPARWNRVEVFYSGTKAGNIDQLASLDGTANPKDLNCHFVICNGLGGCDGQIQTTDKWLKQWSIVPGKNWYGSGQTIRICIISDNNERPMTQVQTKRCDSLVQALYRKFDINLESIYYPSNWQ